MISLSRIERIVVTYVRELLFMVRSSPSPVDAIVGRRRRRSFFSATPYMHALVSNRVLTLSQRAALRSGR